MLPLSKELLKKKTLGTTGSYTADMKVLLLAAGKCNTHLIYWIPLPLERLVCPHVFSGDVGLCINFQARLLIPDPKLPRSQAVSSQSRIAAEKPAVTMANNPLDTYSAVRHKPHLAPAKPRAQQQALDAESSTCTSHCRLEFRLSAREAQDSLC